MYCGSWFRRFQSIVTELLPFGPVAAEYITADMNEGGVFTSWQPGSKREKLIGTGV